MEKYLGQFAPKNCAKLGLIDGIEKKKRVFMENKPQRGDMLTVGGCRRKNKKITKSPAGQYVGRHYSFFEILSTDSIYHPAGAWRK